MAGRAAAPTDASCSQSSSSAGADPVTDGEASHPPQIVGAGGVNSPDDIVWQREYERLAIEELPRVRAAAEKWLASLGALTGLFAAVVVVKGRDDIGELTQDARVGVACLVLGAFTLAVVAIVLGAHAAQGAPRKRELDDGRALRRWSSTAAQTASGLLRWSRILAILAVGLMAAAVGATWFGPTIHESRLLLVSRTGATVCGRVESGPPVAGVRLKTSTGVVTLPASAVLVALTVAECP